MKPTSDPPVTSDAARTVVTRQALHDGSLLAAARQRALPGTVFRSDAEIEADLDATLAHHPPEHDIWLFGYGSLMWNPAIEFTERRAGIVRGWHRRYCLWLHLGRGSPENPGLMLALDRGGSCGGVLLRIAAAEARAELLIAWRREMFTHAYHSRWVTAYTQDGPVRAVTFVANRAYSRYAGRLDEAQIGARLATAAGALGTCRDYLVETVHALRALGLRDRSLERLHRQL